MRIGFDNDKYISMQAEHIKKRIEQLGGKLYLEFGGKLFDDMHASRVLPGFKPDAKVSMLKSMKNDVEIIFAINANDIEQNKVRSDLGISYDEDVLRLMDILRGMGFLRGRGGYYAIQRPDCRRCVSPSSQSAWHHILSSLPDSRISERYRPHRKRRGLRQERIYRNHAPARGGDGSWSWFRQDGNVPLAALP